MDPAFVGLQDLDHGADDQAGGVELTPALAFAARELAKEIFVDPAQQVAGLLRHPEDVFGQVFVGIFGAGRCNGGAIRPATSGASAQTRPRYA